MVDASARVGKVETVIAEKEGVYLVTQFDWEVQKDRPGWGALRFSMAGSGHPEGKEEEWVTRERGNRGTPLLLLKPCRVTEIFARGTLDSVERVY